MDAITPATGAAATTKKAIRFIDGHFIYMSFADGPRV